jgi:hypothetical protein
MAGFIRKWFGRLLLALLLATIISTGEAGDAGNDFSAPDDMIDDVIHEIAADDDIIDESRQNT